MMKITLPCTSKNHFIVWPIFLVLMLLFHATNAYSLTSCVADKDGDKDVDGSDLIALMQQYATNSCGGECSIALTAIFA